MTYRQRLFVAAYLDPKRANGNATKAACMAGYSCPEKAGPKALGYPAIRAAIDAKLDHVALTVDESLARVGEIAAADIGDFIDVDPHGQTWKFNIAKAKQDKRLGVIRKLKHHVETRTDRNGNPVVTEHVELEMYSKLDALDRLMRFHGLYRDRLDVTSGDESIKTVLYLPDNGRDPGLNKPISPSRPASKPSDESEGGQHG